MAGLRIRDLKMGEKSPYLETGENFSALTNVDWFRKQMAEAKEFGQRVVENKDENQKIRDSLVDIKKMLPWDFEIMGWQMPDGSPEVTVEMLERAVKEVEVETKVNAGVKLHRRDFMVIYRYGDVEVTTANDGTVWFLDKSKDVHEWVRMKESGYPELPQD